MSKNRDQSRQQSERSPGQSRGDADAEERLERAADELASQLAERESLVRQADQSSPYSIPLGASNAPFDCGIYSGDFRERLPEGDPVIKMGGEIRKHGSQEAVDAMKAAHEAGLAVARRLTNGH